MEFQSTHHSSWRLMHLSLIHKGLLFPFESTSWIPMESTSWIHNYKLCKQSVHKEYQNAFNCMVITLWDAQFQERSYMSLNLDFLLIFWSHQQHPDSEFSVHTFQGGKGTPFWGIQIPYLNNNSNEYLYILSLLSVPPSLTLYPWLT